MTSKTKNLSSTFAALSVGLAGIVGGALLLRGLSEYAWPVIIACYFMMFAFVYLTKVFQAHGSLIFSWRPYFDGVDRLFILAVPTCAVAAGYFFSPFLGD